MVRLVAAASSACPANVATSYGAVRTSIHVYNINVINKGNEMNLQKKHPGFISRNRRGSAMALAITLLALLFMTIILTSCSNVQVEPVLIYGSNSDDNEAGVKLKIPF
jgi:hypothetical protein